MGLRPVIKKDFLTLPKNSTFGLLRERVRETSYLDWGFESLNKRDENSKSKRKFDSRRTSFSNIKDIKVEDPDPVHVISRVYLKKIHLLFSLHIHHLPKGTKIHRRDPPCTNQSKSSIKYLSIPRFILSPMVQSEVLVGIRRVTV